MNWLHILAQTVFLLPRLREVPFHAHGRYEAGQNNQDMISIFPRSFFCRVLAPLFLAPIALLAADGLTVSVQIDGTSQLIVKPDQVYWNHILHARPGRNGGGDLPTKLNDYLWYPQWAVPGDVGAGPSLPIAISVLFNTIPVSIVQTAGRGTVTIIQQPASTNDFTLIVNFEDPTPGPETFSIRLSGLSVDGLPSKLKAEVASILVSWPTETNRLYQLQYSSALTTNTWVDLAPPIQGHGTNATFFDNVLGEPHRFYRVLPLP